MDSIISIKVIASELKRKELFGRLIVFCEKNNLEYRILQDEPYWKIENLFEIGIELSPAPVWNYGKWSEVYKFLFEQEFTIEWGPNEDISLCNYPTSHDLDSCFVVFCIPSKSFFPKPSKTIRHGY